MPSNRARPLLALLVAVVLLPLTAGVAYGSRAADQHTTHLAWLDVGPGTTDQYRGLDVVSRRVVWIGSNSGTVLRTLNGGRSWQDVSPPGVNSLQFRDVAAFGPRAAVVLAAGVGTASQIWRTRDGGATWRQTFQNAEPGGFYDCMAFWDRRHGIAVGDPVGGRWEIVRTWDGGRSWHLLPFALRPVAAPSEFGFAASGTCVAVAGERRAWIGTGGNTSGIARVLRSVDRGRHWSAVETPVAAAPAGGIFSLAFRNTWRGIAVGGDFTAPTSAPRGGAWTIDGGRRWHLSRTPLGGYRSGVAWLPWWPWGAVAVGPTGSDITWDVGRHWRTFDTSSLDSIDCSPDGACYGSGAGGRVARLVPR